MSVVAAHLTCLVLVLADLVARSWRIQWLLRGLGYRISFREAFGINTIGDAACAVSPLRIAGEPARLGTMLRAGVPATAAFVAITYEVLAAWPVVILVAIGLAWRYAPDWWATAGPALRQAGDELGPAAALVLLLSVLVWWWARRRAPAATHHWRRPLMRTLVHWRRMPKWPLLASLPLSFVNVAARTAILPILASTLPHPPPVGPVLIGSFGLLYSQLILPTPSGAGAVDLGLLAGAAGEFGDREGGLLLAWRGYTTLIGLLLGFGFALQVFGAATLRRLLRRGTPL